MRIALTGVGLWLLFLVGYDKGVHDSLCKVALAQQVSCSPGNTCSGSGPVIDGPKACAPWKPFQ